MYNRASESQLSMFRRRPSHLFWICTIRQLSESDIFRRSLPMATHPYIMNKSCPLPSWVRDTFQGWIHGAWSQNKTRNRWLAVCSEKLHGPHPGIYLFHVNCFSEESETLSNSECNSHTTDFYFI